MQYRTLSSLVAQSSRLKSGPETVAVPKDLFRELLVAALRYKGEFDEHFYLAANPDIGAAIASGEISGGADHYYNAGYFENRMPKKLTVDESFYLEHNLDVVNAIRAGTVASAQEHFDHAGFKEGRSPYAGFSLF